MSRAPAFLTVVLDLRGYTCCLYFHISHTTCSLKPCLLIPKPALTPPECLPKHESLLTINLPSREATEHWEKGTDAQLGIRPRFETYSLLTRWKALSGYSPFMSFSCLNSRKGLTAQGDMSNSAVTHGKGSAHSSCTIRCNFTFLLLLVHHLKLLALLPHDLLSSCFPVAPHPTPPPPVPLLSFFHLFKSLSTMD